MKARVLRTNKIVEVEYLGKLGKFSKIFRDIQSGIEYTEKDIDFCFDLETGCYGGLSRQQKETRRNIRIIRFMKRNTI